MRRVWARRSGGAGRGRISSVGALVGLAVALAIVVALGVASRPGGLPSPIGSPGPSAAANGPLVFYEILDAKGSSLMERRLDGHSLARRVALRTDVDHGRTWTVDPSGLVAVAVVPVGEDQELEAIAVTSGASLRRIRTPAAPLDDALWSPDGRRLALLTGGAENAPRALLVIEVGSGTVARAHVPDDAVLQGFDPSGRALVRQRLTAPADDRTTGWRFLRFDPAVGTLDPVAGLPDVGPASDWTDDVHPAAGIAVEAVVGPDQGTSLRLWPLRAGGTARVIATFPSVDRIALDPSGTGVAVSVGQAIRHVSLDGRSADLFAGDDAIADFGWSVDGDYLAVATDRRGPNLTVVERATGRVVALPQASAVAQSLFVRIVGGVALPASPLPTVEPTPTPTPGPSGPDVAGFAGILSGRIEGGPDRPAVHAERLVPTDAGGLRQAAAMDPVPIDPALVADGNEPIVTLLPRPGSDDILVWVESSLGSSGWLWDGRTARTPVDLPPDWPSGAYDLAWRPDGAALAASAGRTTVNGEFEGIFAVATLGGARTQVLPIIGEYNRLEGWWSPSELRVGHGICAEGCVGRYAESARLRIADRRLVQLTPADRARAAIDLVTFDGRTIVLSLLNEDPADDIVIDWPGASGPAVGPDDGADVLGFASDRRSLLVAAENAAGTDLYRIEDPVGRAVRGRLADPRPVAIGHLAGRGLRLDVAPGEGWVIATDRVDDVHLVRLTDGRSWTVERGRTLMWAAAFPSGG